jgi:hypothetical protein
MQVRRAAVPVLLWCLATAASIAVASLALRPVLHTAVPQDSVPAAGDGRAGGRQAITQTLPAQATGSPPARPTATAGSAPASGPPATARSSPAGAKQTPTAAPARVVDGWTVTTGGDGVEVYLRSFRSDGGDAVIRIRAAAVSVVTATPRDGYSVSRLQSEPTRLVVQFTAANGTAAYQVDCMWWQDAPHGTVTRIGS